MDLSSCLISWCNPFFSMLCTNAANNRTVEPGLKRKSLENYYGARCTQRAADGTPCWVTTNNMYQPGGARLGLWVRVALMTPPACEAMSRSTRRWPQSNEWVVTQLLMMLTQRIFPAAAEVILTVCP